jgi:amidase
VAAGLAPVAIGTETDGSIICPSAASGIVGIKPTVGLVPRTHIVPISATQDTAGPMALTVADAAAVLTVIAGSDPGDPASAEADAKKSDSSKALDASALQGKRIGVAAIRRLSQGHRCCSRRAGGLKAAGAELVELKEPAAKRDGRRSSPSCSGFQGG